MSDRETLIEAIKRATTPDPERVLLEIVEAFGQLGSDEQAELLGALGRSLDEACADKAARARQVAAIACELGVDGRVLVRELADAVATFAIHDEEL